MKYLTAFVMTVLLAACGSPDKKAELEKKKSDYAALGEEIRKLEAEVAASDTTVKVAKVKDVVVMSLQPELFRHYIDVQGAVDSDENVDILPKMPGRVQRVLVKEGDVVKAGQVLAEIDHEMTTRQLNALQPQLDLTREMFERQERLWNQKIGSEMQYLQAKSQKESLERQVETLKEQADMALVKSPINGTVDYVGLKTGEMAAGSIRVVNLSGLKVKGNIAETYASKVKRGNSVVIHFPDLNKDIEEKITFAARVIDPMTRTFSAEADLNGESGEYHPNMVAIMKIVDYEKSGALVIPINIIQNSNDEQYVFVAVVEGNRAVARKKVVSVGHTYAGKAEILSGLSPNDNVVTAGQLDIVDGMQIKF